LHGVATECNSTRYKDRPAPKQQSGSENDTTARLCHQPESSPAVRNELRMAQSTPAAASGEAARTEEGGLAIRLQLCRAQTAAPAETDGATAGKTEGAVRLNREYRSQEPLPVPAKLDERQLGAQFRQISTRQKPKPPVNPVQSGARH
jgi:hypothetical protein